MYARVIWLLKLRCSSIVIPSSFLVAVFLSQILWLVNTSSSLELIFTRVKNCNKTNRNNNCNKTSFLPFRSLTSNILEPGGNLCCKYIYYYISVLYKVLLSFWIFLFEQLWIKTTDFRETPYASKCKSLKSESKSKFTVRKTNTNKSAFSDTLQYIQMKTYYKKLWWVHLYFKC